MNNWSKLIYERLYKHAKENAVDWSNVKDFIEGCIADGGVPMFKDRYAGKRFDGRVLAICYAGRGFYPSHQWFKNVPEEDIELIESKTGEWKDLLARKEPTVASALHEYGELVRKAKRKREEML